MNWFTKSFVSDRSLEKKKALVEEWGGCDHVEADPSLLAVVSYENDSFGREGICLCSACWEQVEEEEGEEEVICHDCGQTFQKKDTIEWKWYDFYYPQGDEPLIICGSCRIAEKHVNRRRKDRADYEEEMNQYD